MELVRVTESAALAASRWVGRGDKNGVDKAAVDAMRTVLATVPMSGIIVIGEGEKDEAPMLFNGEAVGDGSKPETDVAVDPIDGTRDYVRGRSGYCVSVALVADGLPVFAVMAAPAQGKVWVAAHGEGVTCNGERLVGSRRLDFTGSRVPADDLPKLDADLVTVTKPNSIAMRMTMVACDRADLVATLRWGNEWDIAAAHLVAQEAGGVVTDALGRPIRYNKREPLDFGLICCAPGIHQAAVERLSGRAAAILSSS